MADTPAVLGRRYLPFLAVAVVQVMLAAVAPSRGVSGSSQAVGSNGSGYTVPAGANSNPGNNNGVNATGTSPGGVNGTTSGVTGTNTSGGVNGTSTAGGTSGTDTSGVNGSTLGNTTTGPIGATGPVDRSDCDRNGNQIGPPGYLYMPPCVPVWHGGNNGGATMPGVTATQIRFTLFRAQANAQVNAILATQGLAASTTQSCQADEAFLKVINRFWSEYGRTFVPVNGPGSNAGTSQQGCSGFPYFQSQCPLTPPDPNCDAAEAKIVGNMHVAMVLGGGDIFFNQALIPFHIPIVGGGELPESYYSADAPYLWGILMDGDRQANLDAEYWCKKLNNGPAGYAGSDVKTTRGWGTPATAVPIRRIAILYPVNNGDQSTKLSVDLFKKLISGGMCSNSSPVLEIDYASNINTAQQQSETIVQELIANHITTVACWCDPIAPLFLTEAMTTQTYTPEQFVLGVGLLDYDVLARLYLGNEWQHAFGVSDLALMPPFSQSDATHWWQSAGNAGEPDATEPASVPAFSFMATAFQLAGPTPTPQGIATALQDGPTFGGWAKLHNPTVPEISYKNPSPWTASKDVREVYWNANRTSEIDGKSGSYCPVNGGERYDPGGFQPGTGELFNTKQNGC